MLSVASAGVLPGQLRAIWCITAYQARLAAALRDISITRGSSEGFADQTGNYGQPGSNGTR